MVLDSNFPEFWEKLSKICVDEDGEAFCPDGMADKGTKIRGIIEQLGGKYFCPSQVAGGVDVTLDDLNLSERIARARGHVERAIGRVKRFNILTNGLSHRLVPMIDDLLYFCAFVSHFF